MLLWLARRLRSTDDRGIGMILVIGTATVVMALVIIGGTMATRALVQSRSHVSFESAIAVAEDGIDQVLARAQTTYQNAGTDSYVYPSATATCGTSSGISWTTSAAPDGTAAPGSFANLADGLAVERAWAKSWLTTLAQTASCRTHTSQGDYVFFKPSGHQVIYSMGWSPGYGRSDSKMRYVKNEYLFTPYAPSNAILTSGNLQLDSSTTVTSAPGFDTSVASVHSNGLITVANGNPTVYGAVSQTGTGSTSSSNKFYANTCSPSQSNCTAGQVQISPKQDVRFFGARSIWGSSHAANVFGGWYDLCGNGTVQSPTGTAPCTGGSQLADVSGGGSFRGWTFTTVNGVPTWKATSAIKQNGYSGTYYIDGGDAVASASNAGSAVPNMTVIAAAKSDPTTNPTGLNCTKVGGNISWDHIDMAAPSVKSTFMIADQDILTNSNFSAGSASGGTVVSGFFIAGDQISMQTSSAGAYGAVVAADQCNPSPGSSLVDSNEIKNPSIYYDPTEATPFVDIVNTTLWLEYAG